MTVLYKYRSANRAVDLRSRTIRLTPPGAFNDPFEALPAVAAAWESETLKQLEAETHRAAQADGVLLDEREVRGEFELMNEVASTNGSPWVIRAANELSGWCPSHEVPRRVDVGSLWTLAPWLCDRL